MNPENETFFNQEEETTENKAEEKENKEQINLSLATVADLVRQIKETGFAKVNDYQNSCEYAVIHNKAADEYHVWSLVADLQADEHGWSEFIKALPGYYEKAGDKNMKVFFCGSEYDIPLDRKSGNTFDVKPPYRYITPDGIQYQVEFIKDINEHGEKYTRTEIKYVETARLSPEEVERQAETVIKAFGEHKPFSDYGSKVLTPSRKILDHE